ncbi:MAG TPA: heparan-alpha-glucosaminide N-acetyltransferase domain-containing protein [Gammaproteobacteria bacterium]|nr:heparan-alpha-glucosaminide N-acetyltransferase domain-containing protein [Gammaproteobacteria bacterium]
MDNKRLLSLDAFRGLTIALMIIVNSPGNYTAYSLFQHSAWNGCTLADIVFPFFLFMVGVSIPFSLRYSREMNQEREITYRIVRRSFILFAIGVFLNAFPHNFDLGSIRIMGILQRIAICYLVAALLFLKTTIKTQAISLVLILIGYGLLLTLPFNSTNHFSPENNLAIYIDHLFFSSAHLYHQSFEPEGLLSTLPAIATTLLGNLTGQLLCSKAAPKQKLLYICLAGIVTTILGWLLGLILPINKGMWTSSYVLWTGGLALLMLSLLYWIIEIKKLQRWTLPLRIFSLNAIAAYILHIFFLKVQGMVNVTQSDGSIVSLRLYITDYLFSWANPNNASLFYAIYYMLFWLLILSLLYRQKIIIKV